MPPAPRTNGQRFLLTWSQAPNIDINELADYLHSLADGCNWVEIVQEHHQDQGVHYHAVICFDARFQQPLTIFDHGGRSADIQPIRNATTALTTCRHYLRKGNRPKEEEHDLKSHKRTPCDYTAEVTDRGDVPEYAHTTGRLSWAEIIDAATDQESFLQLCKQHRTSDFVLRHEQIRNFIERYYCQPTEYVPQFPPESYIIPADLDRWVQEVFGEVSIFRIPFTRNTQIY